MSRTVRRVHAALAGGLVMALIGLPGTAAGAASPSLRVNDVAASENIGKAVFTVRLSASSTRTVTVHYATTDGTAKAPGDYTARSGTLTFSAGQTSRTVTVVVVNDTRPEFAETFRLVLSSPANATIADGTGTATIAPND